MARRTGSSCRICRREGEKLFLKGTRCSTDRCALTRREYSPGQHGQETKRAKMSNYSVQLREKQKAKRTYGLLEKQFKNYFKKAENSKGVTGEILLQFLERRLDNMIYRASFTESRNKARQMVRHGFVKVNGRKVNIPSFLVSPGDEVVFAGKKETQKSAVRDTIKVIEDHRAIPDWIEISAENLKANVKRMPTKKDIGMEIAENLIVELYSK
jgi:small subunit ribosomal protein S4